MDNTVLTVVPSVEVKLNDVIKVLNKAGSYRFLVVDKKFSNDATVIDALIKAYDIQEISISK